MVAPNTAYQVNKEQAAGLVKFCKTALQHTAADWQMRNLLLETDFAYMRERNYGAEHLRAKAANSYGDKSRIQDVTIPIVMPQVEAGVGYLHNAFLSGYPIFGVVSDDKNMNEAMQMDTLMAEHGHRGGWIRQFNMFFRDALKYNIAPIEVNWCEETVYTAETDTMLSGNGKGRAKEINWAGNKIKRLDPYNSFWDMRVAPADVHKFAEFAGYVEMMSRTHFKQFVQDLPNKIIGNVKTAMESGTGSVNTYYIPQLNPTAFMQRTDAKVGGNFDWASWARDDVEQKIKYKNMYEVTTIYARIIPQDFGLAVPARNMPQIWKLIIVNNEILIYAERQTNAHNYLPILVGQPLEDGLGYQTKSFAQNVAPLQDIGSALVNAALHSRRRSVYDRLAYDPSRVSAADINSNNPIARIPMRPAAYGKPVGDAFHQFPYRDDQSGTAMQELQMINGFAEMTNGINRVQQGQFQKGNKTRHEYQDVMQHSNDRLQTIAQFLEAQVFTPLKEILKLNILQYAPSQEVYNRESKQVVQVNPIELRQKSLEFKISDGLLPIDKLIDADTFQVALQVFGSSPQLQQDFDVSKFLIYYLKTQGAKNLEEFRYTPEEKQQRLQQQQAMMAAQQGQGAQPPQNPPTGAPQA